MEANDIPIPIVYLEVLFSLTYLSITYSPVTLDMPYIIIFLLLARLESAYSLIFSAHEIWGQDLGTFMINRSI